MIRPDLAVSKMQLGNSQVPQPQPQQETSADPNAEVPNNVGALFNEGAKVRTREENSCE